MWKKQGLIFVCNFYGTGYAQDAFIDVLDEKRWRIYYSTRTKDVVSLPYSIDVEAGNPKNIIGVQREPLFLPGYAGTFDENGITMTSIVNTPNGKYIYYCGWNRRSTVPYALSIGVVAVAEDKIIRLFDGPIMDRSKHDPICVSAPHVIYDADLNVFKMWYITFTEWKEYNGRKEPIFVIKTAFSFDGIDWEPITKPCFKQAYEGESFARPCVIKDGDLYRMWFSERGPEGYRDKGGQHYMIGYAESNNGENFKRAPIDFPLSEEGWDSEMLCYASVIRHNDVLYMLYNGNDFGKTGFGFATFNLK